MPALITRIANRARRALSAAGWVAVVVIVSINVAWAHQTILMQALPLHPYYENGYQPPFEHRTLLRIIYFLLFGGRIHEIAMNAPLASSAQVFQLVVDTACLCLTLLCMIVIAGKAWPASQYATRALAAAAFLLLIVVFGYFFVPNKPFFYPYDFLELLIFASFIALGVFAGRWTDALSILLLALGALNKETALFGWFIYLLLSRSDFLYAPTRAQGVQMLLFGTIAAIVFLAMKSAAIYATTLLPASGISVIDDIYLNQLANNISQLRNPLFWFVVAGMFSYLYIPVALFWRRLDRLDACLLALVLTWVALMFYAGIFRELRLYAPMSLVLYFILLKMMRGVRITLA